MPGSPRRPALCLSTESSEEPSNLTLLKLSLSCVLGDRWGYLQDSQPSESRDERCWLEFAG